MNITRVIVGIAFVAPSFLMVLAPGFTYVHGGLPWMQAVFCGIGAAVIGIIAVGSYKLTRKTLGKDSLLWTIFTALAIITFITEKEIVWLILLRVLRIGCIKQSRSFLAFLVFSFHPYYYSLQVQIGQNPKAPALKKNHPILAFYLGLRKFRSPI
jgi:chromate transport protein ChrA